MAPGALSPRNANYTIDARLDPDSRLLSGSLILEWRNLQQQATNELWFHLYWNGWRNNRSTWMLEDRIRGRSSAGKDLEEEDWAYQVIESATLLDVVDPVGGNPDTPVGSASGSLPGDDLAVITPAERDLLPSLRFVAADDGNRDDRTVAVFDLPRPVEPGQTVRLEMAWRARVPRTFARTGAHGDFFFIAHWFPKLGVFEAEGWNCHQFHSATEFYSDYGVYDVELTLPERFIVGATGKLQSSEPQEDGTATHRYLAEDVHGFAWTASPHFEVHTSTFLEPGLPAVEMRLLLQPEHGHQAERHFAATRAALKYYGEWYGPYPYDYVTIVDPAFGSGAGGMEYPTLFTAGTRILNPLGGGSPEGVTIHEAGHQFWYGVVGNNEFEHAWLDEGLNTFSTARAYEAAYGRRKLVEGYFGPPGRGDRAKLLKVLFPQVELSREVHGNRMARFRSVAGWADPQAVPTYLYYPSTAARISYDKTALWLATLERYLGWETLQGILSTFYERFSFRHPEPEDFFAVANEVARRNLDWFFDQVHGGSQVFDYAIRRAESKPHRLEGLAGPEEALRYFDGRGNEGAREGEEKIYRTEVTVSREADGVFPVEVLLTFEDGSELRRIWNGEDRWLLITEERPVRLRSAEVDPQRILLLDVDRTNNSRLLESQARFPAVKWSSHWMIWMQDLLQSTLVFF